MQADPHIPGGAGAFTVRSTMWTCLAAALIVAVGGFAMWRACAIYPFYMIWDMDATTAIDVVCVNSGLTPDNIGHPDCGMYLLLSAASRLARAMGLLSAVDLPELAASLNPLACMAEATGVVRAVSPLINMLAILLIWGALVSLWRPSRPLHLVVLAVLVSQQSLIYLSSMSRPASFCLLFWGVALGLIALARRLGVLRWRVAFFLMSAVVAGICFLTKIQSLLYVLALPLFMVIQRPGGIPSTDTPVSSLDRRHALVASLMGSLLFFGLLLVLWRLDMPEFAGFYATAYGFTARLKMLSAAASGLLMVNVWYSFLGGRTRAYPPVFYWYSFALPGLILAFPVCILLAGDFTEGVTYMLWAAKVALMRQDYSGYVGLTGILRKLLAEGIFLWPTFLCHVLALLGALGVSVFGGRRRIAQVLPLVALSGIVVVNLGMATRCILRDIMWMEVLLNVVTVSYLFYISRTLRDNQRPWRVFPAIVLLVVLLFNVCASARMYRRVEANYNVYGWDPMYWCRRYYAGRSHEQYHVVMAPRYSAAGEATARDMSAYTRHALRRALSCHQDERWARFVFPTLLPSIRALGPFVQGAPVWCSRTDWLIDGVSHETLRGTLVVDPFACARRSSGLLDRESVSEHSEWFRKLKPGRPGELLAVLPRSDTRIYLFVRQERVKALQAVAGIQAPVDMGALSVTLRKGGSTQVLSGVEVRQYAELGWSELGPDAFFVLESLL